ncbi:MAG: Rv3654c family TadE-like protein [Actinomycetota bacterium]
MSVGDERGSAAVSLLGLTAVVMALILGLADLTAFLLARANAQTAADAAALAAAGEMIPGPGGRPEAQASRFAGANGARLVECLCGRSKRSALVKVAVPVRFLVVRALGTEEVFARARAEVDLGQLGRGGSAKTPG